MLKIAVVCLLFLKLAYSEDSHIIDECSNPGDTPMMLFGQSLIKPAIALRVQEETIRVPAQGFAPKPITCITVVNMGAVEDAGFATIEAGGLGSDYVFIHLKSQVGKGFNFLVNVYYDLTEAK